MSPRMHPVFVTLALLATLGAGCAGTRREGTASRAELLEPSPTLAPLIYYEEGKVVFLAVNAHLARFRLDQQLIPLEIAVANKGLPKLTVAPEFVMLSETGGNGRRWPVATPEESAGKSLRSNFDRNLMPVPFPEIVKLRFPTYLQAPATYGFRPGDLTITRTVELPQRSWMLGQIWIPNPDPGEKLKGRVFDLELRSPELPDPVFVRLRF